MKEIKDNLTVKKQIEKPWLFETGISGNYKGRPKGTISLISKIKKVLASKPKDEKNSYAELMAKALLSKALKDKDILLMVKLLRMIKEVKVSLNEEYDIYIRIQKKSQKLSFPKK